MKKSNKIGKITKTKVDGARTLPCPTYSRWTTVESRWFSGVHLESRRFFFSWEHSQIGMHNPPGFHQDSRWTWDEPHGVSGVPLPDGSVDSIWTQSRINPPGVQKEGLVQSLYYFTINSKSKAKNKMPHSRIEPRTIGIFSVIQSTAPQGHFFAYKLIFI